MKFQSTLMYLGCETHANKNGEAYWKVLFADGVDPLNVITRDESVTLCDPYRPYDCTFNYNAKYESLTLVEMKERK